jgi:hypothetical protein
MAEVALDLFLQDFVNTNRIRGAHVPWETLCARRSFETGIPSVFRFESGGQEHFATGQVLNLPDADWFRIELTHTIPEATEHRFDYLRMLFPITHTDLKVDTMDTGIVLVKLTTRHRGLMNMVFVIRDGEAVRNPFLV